MFNGRITFYKKNATYSEHCNYGDWFQTFAVDHIYKTIGIKKEDIDSINITELRSYFGNDIRTIIYGQIDSYCGHEVFPISKCLKPVFMGFHRTYGLLRTVNSLNRSPIIGCRDEATRNAIRKLGLDAYVCGCLTMALPKRTGILGKEVLFIDTPKQIENYIPETIKNNIVYYSNEKEISYNPEAEASAVMEQLKKAKMVVTSRLHIASPCIAMGIPVILVRDYYDNRYSWIEKYIHPYLPDEFDSIDWNPKVIDTSFAKDSIFGIFSAIFNNDIPRAIDLLRQLDFFYLNRDRIEYRTPLITRCYWILMGLSPNLANSIRKRLKKYTVISNKS